jgi:Zn-finger nucleic acid-binding protein
MVIREVPQGHYTECTKCGGIWLDVKSFDRLVEQKDEAAIGTILKKMKKSDDAREAAPETVKYIPCPECGNLMHRKNYAKCSGIIIDWCKGHGFWFDGDELEKTIRFVQSGGLDKARRLDIERARSELSRLEDRKRAVAHAGMGGGAGAWKFERDTSDLSIDLGDVLGSAVSALVRRFF